MTADASAYGALTGPATLTISRLLPGPIERVWAYLTQSDLRRQWLASGEMQSEAGSGFELVWRNSELTDPPGQRPDGFGEEHRMPGNIIACDPPRRLVITWGKSSEVNFTLEDKGEKVLLTVTHIRLPDREAMLMVGAGWQYGSLAPSRSEEPEPEPAGDDIAALLDEAEDIVNMAGIEILSEQEKRARKKFFRRKKRR